MASENDENIAMLQAMGFDRTQALRALNDCGSLERAIDSLLNGGGAGRRDDVALANTAARSDGRGRAVHSEVSQYSDGLGRSACTSIALTMACDFLDATAADDPEAVVDSAFLSDSVRAGIETHRRLRRGADVEHASVEELLDSCRSADDPASERIASSLEPLPSSPRQGVLSRSPGDDGAAGLRAALSRCRSDAADARSYVAAVITKPPESVLVLLPPRDGGGGGVGRPSGSYALLDSHPRPSSAPHRPSGSYALFHPTLDGLVASLEEIFPATELGDDVPELMAMMYNSFDVYPFQHRRRPS